LLIDGATKQTACVDPAEPQKILDALERHKIPVTSMTHALTTHKHWDHAGGNVKLKELVPHIEIVGGTEDKVPAATINVNDGAVLRLGELTIKALHAPCHTRGHVLYYVTPTSSSASTKVAENTTGSTKATSVSQGALFTGDTLFTGGCGKFFEGTAADMYEALYSKIGKLPDDTLLYTGHEYTVSNLKFAASLEPKNEHVARKLAWSIERVARNECTQPSTIADERTYNPFMRVHLPHITAMCGATCTPVDALNWVRDRKNNFRASS